MRRAEAERARKETLKALAQRDLAAALKSGAEGGTSKTAALAAQAAEAAAREAARAKAAAEAAAAGFCFCKDSLRILAKNSFGKIYLYIFF